MEIIFFIIAIIIAAIRSGNNNHDWINRPFGRDRRYNEFDMYNSYRYRTPADPILVAMTIAIIITFFFAPVIGVILIPIAIFAYRFIKKGEVNRNTQKRRKEALLKAKVFLLPYKDIWKNLTLSNKYCSLKLKSDGMTIIGAEKKQDPYLPYRTFRITGTNVFDYKELWNLFCINFAYNKSYDGLLEDCNTYRASIYEDIITPELPKPQVRAEVNLIDINNCSEAELTALPGISIVISKKIIKKREEIGGFKGVDDFLAFVKLKPNVSKQLEPKICVNKMKGSLNIKRNDERMIDL